MLDVSASPAECSLSDALWRYAADPVLGRRYLDLFARSHIRAPSSDLLTFDEMTAFEQLRVGFETGLVDFLTRGDLQAFWHPPGSTELQPIAATWWRSARLDLRNGRAESNGMPVSNVTVRRSGGVGMDASAPPPPDIKPHPRCLFRL